MQSLKLVICIGISLQKDHYGSQVLRGLSAALIALSLNTALNTQTFYKRYLGKLTLLHIFKLSSS